MIRRPMQRYAPKEHRREFCAYDLETTRIDVGTPRPLYLTVYGERGLLCSQRTDRFGALLRSTMFRDDQHRMRYVAWNGNRFDALLVIRALLQSSREYQIRPYLTQTGNLRGARVIRGKYWWELLDGMAMLGMDAAGGWPLRRFLSVYAPELPKGELDFDKQSFDADNTHHVAYAERDSEGLYHALRKVDDLSRTISGRGLQVTIGNAGIKFFQRSMPDGAICWEPPYGAADAMHRYVMRGGYCYTHRQFDGAIWQYDMNQAYAAAMRDERLPAGSCVRAFRFDRRRPGIYECMISRRDRSPLPFYCKRIPDEAAIFCYGERTHTYLTSTEVRSLRRHGWKVRVLSGFYWTQSFSCREMVDQLETLRRSDPAGPNGPIGTLAKYLGCATYGKTVERVDREEVVVSRRCPEGYQRWRVEDERFAYFWFRRQPEGSATKVYHQPQIGCFITAHVRLKVWEAGLAAADAFIKCDTDSVAFSRPVAHLTLHPTHYGDWKKELDGAHYLVVAKKVYAAADGSSFKAKGLNVRKLTVAHYRRWLMGRRPFQVQLQKASFRGFLSGEELFARQRRRGTDPSVHAPPVR